MSSQRNENIFMLSHLELKKLIKKLYNWRDVYLKLIFEYIMRFMLLHVCFVLNSIMYKWVTHQLSYSAKIRTVDRKI